MGTDKLLVPDPVGDIQLAEGNYTLARSVPLQYFRVREVPMAVRGLALREVRGGKQTDVLDCATGAVLAELDGELLGIGPAGRYWLMGRPLIPNRPAMRTRVDLHLREGEGFRRAYRWDWTRDRDYATSWYLDSQHRLVVLGLGSGAMIVADPTSEEPPLRVRAHAEDLEGIAYAPGPRLLGTVSRDNTARLWPLDLGELLDRRALAALADPAVFRALANQSPSAAVDALGRLGARQEMRSRTVALKEWIQEVAGALDLGEIGSAEELGERLMRSGGGYGPLAERP